EKIKSDNMSPRQLISEFNVTFIGTTDHPLDDLNWHEKIAADESFDTVVAPTFRPDEAFADHVNFKTFVSRLSGATDVEIKDYDTFLEAMEKRIVYFKDHGARATDHSISAIAFEPASKDELNAVFTKALNEEALSSQEV